ncbi:MAG: ABC transporter substrate-binding protein [Gammaproteobacteria bacterium]|nr:MAG: ABC transporter substrate-binding protein [Gammaproteobacteria bacterium]
MILACLTTMANAEDSRTPIEIVTQTATSVAEQVANEREQLESNPDKLFTLVDHVFLPVFDTRYAGRLILGRHGRTATAEQRKQFVDAFYQFLVQSYASNMLKFRKDRIQVFPAPAGQPNNPKRTVVRTQMSLDDGSAASVDYSLRLTPAGWRIFDVRIEGISYVQTYRKQFDAEISARGLDATIARLQAEASPQDMAPADSSTP